VFTELKEEIKGLNISSENGVIFLLTNRKIEGREKNKLN